MSKINTLYLVDDDKNYQFFAEHVINSSGAVDKLKVFGNGREAVQYIQSVVNMNEELPDVIFLDLDMPIMDGWEFLQEFRYLRPILEKKITLFVVTSSVNPKDIIKAKSMPEVKDFIIKPVTKEKFDQLIKNI
ncbi:MAG: response regulator [Crocinitomicaceae bacterium]|nr:response regulator [Crocinitomicaceae bacterium]